jgi:hypothetical protein
MRPPGAAVRLEQLGAKLAEPSAESRLGGRRIVRGACSTNAATRGDTIG